MLRTNLSHRICLFLNQHVCSCYLSTSEIKVQFFMQLSPSLSEQIHAPAEGLPVYTSIENLIYMPVIERSRPRRSYICTVYHHTPMITPQYYPYCWPAHWFDTSNCYHIQMHACQCYKSFHLKISGWVLFCVFKLLRYWCVTRKISSVNALKFKINYIFAWFIYILPFP